MRLRPALLALALLLAGCGAAPPRPLAADEGWRCEPCSRIPRRVTLSPEQLALGAVPVRSAACRGRR